MVGVTATSGGFSDSETVTFVRAEADFISLGAQPLTIPRTETDSTTVTATLSRRSGSVSDNALVEFSVVNWRVVRQIRADHSQQGWRVDGEVHCWRICSGWVGDDYGTRAENQRLGADEDHDHAVIDPPKR